MADERDPKNNRSRKLEGREKRRRFVQGTRAYLHDMTNSVARRAKKSRRNPPPEG